MNEKFALMHAEKALHAIEFMAKMLKVSRAGYYAWVTRRGTLSTAQVRRAAVTAAREAGQKYISVASEMLGVGP